MNVRAASESDAREIAHIHVDTWRTAYVDIVSVDFLKRLSYDRSCDWWSGVLRNPPPVSCFYILETDRHVPVGFAYAAETRSPDLPFKGELYAIYILKEHQGKGGGRLLFDATRSSLMDAGFNSMMLWVLENNPSRGFYERLGGTLAGSKQELLGSQTVTEIVYGWKWDDPMSPRR